MTRRQDMFFRLTGARDHCLAHTHTHPSKQHTADVWMRTWHLRFQRRSKPRSQRGHWYLPSSPRIMSLTTTGLIRASPASRNTDNQFEGVCWSCLGRNWATALKHYHFEARWIVSNMTWQKNKLGSILSGHEIFFPSVMSGYNVTFP